MKKQYTIPSTQVVMLNVSTAMLDSSPETMSFGGNANKSTVVDSKQRGEYDENVHNGWTDGLW